MWGPPRARAPVLIQIPMQQRPIRHLRWYIGGLLFLSTVINYIDRQTLSVLAPYLKIEYEWSNTDSAWVLIGFRVLDGSSIGSGSPEPYLIWRDVETAGPRSPGTVRGMAGDLTCMIVT